MSPSLNKVAHLIWKSLIKSIAEFLHLPSRHLFRKVRLLINLERWLVSRSSLLNDECVYSPWSSVISFLYVCMVNTIHLLNFVETPRKFTKLTSYGQKNRRKQSRHFMYKKRDVWIQIVVIISTDEDPSLRIESSAIINLRGVSTKLNKYIVFTMQTYKKLKY